MDSISQHLRSHRLLQDCNSFPCHRINAASRNLEEVADVMQQQKEEESGASTFMIAIIAICVLFVLGIGLMFWCAFHKNKDYDPQQASQTLRPESVLPYNPNRPNNVAANTTPPDPRRPEKIAVNLYYGCVGASDDMRKMSSGRFKRKATSFEPRQPNPDDECPICWDNFLPGQDYVISKLCNHVYHKSCIEQWTIAEQKDDCPVCRQTLLPSTNLPPPILPPNHRR